MRGLALNLKCVQSKYNANSVISLIIKYLPYVLVVVALKLFLLFVVIGQDKNSRGNTFTITENDYNTLSGDLERDTSETQLQHLPESGNESAILEERRKVLIRLNETTLEPSSHNRTPSTIWLFFNRIPRSGGSTFVSLLQALGEDLDYQHHQHEYRSSWQRLLSPYEQNNLASWFEYNFWPKSYDRLSLFINFTEHRSSYMKTTPAYVTLLRDPVQKFISYFYFKRMDEESVKREMQVRRKTGPGADRHWYWRVVDECVLEKFPECDFENGTSAPELLSSIPFLCGQHEMCLVHNSKWALQMAKYNLEYEYSVVGVLENLNSTLQVLEHYIPLFFRGANQRYWSEEFMQKHEKMHPKKIKPTSEMVIKILKDQFALEYDLYEFAVQRLARQHAKIADLVHMTSPLPEKSPPKKLLSPLERFEVELKRT